MDETPCGAFVELEGSRETLESLIAALALGTTLRLTASYRELFQAVRTMYHLPFTDMIFANFRDCRVDVRACDLS